MNENTNSKNQSANTQNTREEPPEDLEPRDEADEVRGGGNEVAIEGFGSFEPK